ncbi:MAG: exonuclease domain-containing protein [Alphaproteobacteria bacterium]|nr:exonuclease domain-containing protein [Alphaproteobacteria bacterium]
MAADGPARPLLKRLKLLAILPPLGVALAIWLLVTEQTLAAIAALGGSVVGGLVLHQVFSVVRRSNALFERLAGDALLLARQGALPARLRDQASEPGAAGAIAGALVGLERMTATLDSVSVGLIAIDRRGLVVYANRHADAVMGDAAHAGSAVFDVLEREDLDLALQSLGKQAIETELRRVDGVSLAVRMSPLPDQAVLIQLPADAPRLAAFGAVPTPAVIDDDLPLDQLPVVVLDTETTGLKPETDRIVSIGAVRMTGTRRHRAGTIDLLVRPDVPVPLVSAEIHGLTDAMLANEPPFADLWPHVETVLTGCVLVGHHVIFDALILRAEVERNGLVWPDILTLDAGKLFKRFDTRAPDGLDELAEHLGMTPLGRHTALGDALLTADVWKRALEQARLRGIVTWGQLKHLVQ